MYKMQKKKRKYFCFFTFFLHGCTTGMKPAATFAFYTSNGGGQRGRWQPHHSVYGWHILMLIRLPVLLLLVQTQQLVAAFDGCHCRFDYWCLRSLAWPLSPKHPWHPSPQCHSSRSHAESRQPDLMVMYFNLSDAEVVQHVHSACLIIWVRLLGRLDDRCMQDRCFQSVVSMNAVRYQMAPICSKQCSPETNGTTQTHCNSPNMLPDHFWGHIVHMDDNTNAKRILSTLPPEVWRRPGGSPCIIWLSIMQQDLRSHNLTLPEAMDMAQNQSLWRMWLTYGATQSRVACQKRWWWRLW